jgi:WD40 repeat protein
VQPDVAWKAAPDPLPQPVELPADARGSIGVAGFQHLVVYPSTPSPFVCVTQKGPRADVREVWDLRAMKKVGTVDAGSLLENVALSADGAFLAAKNPQIGAPPAVVVWSVADGRPVATLPIGEQFVFNLDVDFAGPGEVFSGRMAGQEAVYQVWDVKTGKELRRVKADAANVERKQRALSAGGKYLALPSKKNDRVVVYDLSTGEAAGEAMLPQKDLFGCHGVAFSPDGKSLAALYPAGGGSRLFVWDMATGKLTADHKIAKSLQQVAPQGFGYQGPGLEWLSDSSGWLAFGALLIDARGAALYWTIPAVMNENLPRRLFGADRVAVVTGDFKGKTLTLKALPADQVAAALKTARGGGADEARPAAKAADWSAVKKLPAPAGAAAWQAKADPAAAPKGKLGARPVPLTGKAADVVRVLFSGPEAGQAAVLSAPLTNELGTRRHLKADRFDLAAGKHLGSTGLFSFEPAPNTNINIDAALSPDGALLAVRGPRGKRIDVYSLAEGKHVVGFSPLERAGPEVVRWAAFVDEKRLLVQTGANLVLWELPACKAVWSLGGVSRPPALSPGRKYVAVCAGASFDLLDAATGERQGTLGGPGVRGVGAAGFRPDGKRLAALVSTADGRNVLTQWDATTGEVVNSSPASVAPAELSWAGDGFVLVGTQLLDLQSGWGLAFYGLPGVGKPATAGPDGRHWFAFARQGAEAPVLAAQTLPDAATKQLARGLADKTIQPALAPGMSVTVNVQGGAFPEDPEGTRRRALDTLTQRLQAQGLKVGPGGTLTLTVQYQGPRATGETREYESFGVGRKQVTKVSVQAVDAVATLSDGRGTIWEQKTTYRTPDPFGLIETNDIQGHLNKLLWNNVANFAAGLGVPGVILRGPNGPQPLPRPVTLAADP